MFSLAYLGIYENAIKSAIETCEAALELLGMENQIDDMDNIAHDIAGEFITVDNITNCFIEAYFIATATLINEKYPEKETDYYVNCDDSHFYIDGEEVY